MVPEAKGNQNDSLYPIIKGTNPSMVEIIVKNIGRIFVFHAFKYTFIGLILGRDFLMLLYSFRI
jgi:hypothetical protein